MALDTTPLLGCERLPIEAQLLRRRYDWLVDRLSVSGSTGVTDVELREDFETAWGRVLDLVLPSLDDDAKAIMWECSMRDVKMDELTRQGQGVVKPLADKQGWGLLKQVKGNRYVLAGESSRELLKTKIATLTPEIRKRLFRKGSKRKKPLLKTGPEPTFKDDGFIIHQISDLHFGRFSRKVNGKNLADYYVDYLKSSEAKNPHMIVICGDLTSIGDGNEFFDALRLIRSLRLERKDEGQPLIRPLYSGSVPDFRKQILLVPGNHDVQWPGNRSDSEGPNDGFSNLVREAACVTPESEVPAIHIAPVNVTVVAVDSAHRGGEEVSSHLARIDERFLRKDMIPVLKVVKQLQGTLGKFIKLGQTSGKHDDSDLLDFYTLFTWGLVDNAFLEKLPQTLKDSRRMSRIDIPAGVTGKTYGPEVRIGVLHHNLSPFAELSLFNDLLNSRKVRDVFVRSGINIILHGHQHQYSVTSEMVYEPRGRAAADTVAKTLHCVGVDSLGIPSQNRLNPSFNEITIHCDASSVDTRRVNVEKVEFEVDGDGRIGREMRISSAELNVETPKLRS